MIFTDYIKLGISVLVCELIGILGAGFNTTGAMRWYDALEKSVLVPPDWVFGVVWPLLYALMGIALFLIWKHHDSIFDNAEKVAIHRKAFTLFWVQLALNFLWSYFFFGLQNIRASLVLIVALWCMILATTMLFARTRKAAGWLLVPYLAWVSFALYLNYMIWMLN